MDYTEILLSIMKISLALAGFSGIAATFQFHDLITLHRGNATGLKMILIYSLMAAFISGFTLMFLKFGFTESQTWTFSSVILAIGLIYHLLATLKNHLKFKVRKKITRIVFAFTYALALLMAIINLLNAFNIIFHKEFAPILSGLLTGLGIACMSFTRLLLLPVWKIVEKKESEMLEKN